MTPLRRVLIVGGSLAGLHAGETLRREGFDGELVILSAEPHRPYDRPPLSKELLRGEMSAQDIALPVTDQLDAEWVLGDPAVELRVPSRSVLTHSGRELPFDGLVIATGSVPRRLPMLDPDREGVMELRTLDDALALRTALSVRPHVTLIGCGFIGVEVACAARVAGASVSVVSLDPPLIVGDPSGLVAGVCERFLVDHGVSLHIGRQVARLDGSASDWRLALDDGTTIETQLVVVAVGARPQTDWLAGSDLFVRDGVICDSSCAAVGVERIVAAGDVARWPNELFGSAPIRIEHWTNSIEQGMAAARTLLRGSGPETVYAPVPSFWSDHFETRLQSVGLPLLGDRTEVVAGSIEERRFVAASYRGEELIGATSYGMVRELVRYRARLARRETTKAGA
jgi:NADPH-dependent 2,4-dienoyl-CoA reductase/sulfur reductase-like enzyme